MKLFCESGQYPGRVADVRPEGLSIGRGPDNDMVLETEGISRHHCKLYSRGGAWYVEDLGSTNGVILNGKKIGAPREIKEGDRIELYDQCLVFTDEKGVASLAAGAAGGTRKPAGFGGAPGESSAEGKSGPSVPWAHLLLLAVLLVIVGWALYSQFFKSADKQEDLNEESSAGAVQTAEQDEQADSNLLAVEDQDQAVLQAEEPPQAQENEALEAELEPEIEVVEGAVEEPEERPAMPAPPETYTVVIRSMPSGAAVKLDGEPKGTTPAVLEDILGGRHSIQLEKEGYDRLTRLIFVPDTVPDEAYELRLEPGVVRITSNPSGASVLHGSQVLGQTPLLVKSLPAGENTIRVAEYGYRSHDQPIEVEEVRGTEVHVELQTLLGSLEVLTLPAGCRVYVDGVFKGITQRAPDVDRNQSLPFVVTGLRAGTRRVRVEHPNGAAAGKEVDIKPGATSTQPFRLWVLDTKLVLKDDTAVYGMLLARNEFGDVTLSVHPDRRIVEFLKDQIAEEEKLTPEQARKFLGGPDEEPARGPEETDAGQVSEDLLETAEQLREEAE